MNKRELMIERAKQFIDEEGKLNISVLRDEDHSLYVRICQIFDGMEDFKKAIQPIECTYNNDKKKNQGKKFYFPTVDSASVRNQLAFEKLYELHDEQQHTYDQIAEKYGVTRQAVHILYKSLSAYYEKHIEKGL